MNKSASHTAASSDGSVRAPAPPGGGGVSSPTLPLLPWPLPAADGDAQLHAQAALWGDAHGKLGYVFYLHV